MATMRALRFHGNKDIRVDEIPVPTLRPGYVKVKNAFAGICGSDLHEYAVGPKNVPVVNHSLTGEKLPTVCGHEFSGTIEQIADGVTDLKVGQKVTVFPILSDMSCHWCEREAYGLCPNWGFLGYSGYGGGMAEYICVERRAIHPIPENMSLEVAALVEPLAVAWHGVNIANVKQDDHCLVVGAGPIGIATVHCLVARGVKSIIVSEISPIRAQNAQRAGAQYVLDPTKEEAAKRCVELSDGLGVHKVFDCAGVQPGFDLALDATRGQGTIVNIAIYEKPLTIKNVNKMNRWSLTYVGSNTYTRQEFQDVIEAISSGAIKNPELMITAKIPLSLAVTQGFEELMANKDKHIKILIDPTQ